jgi:GDPmannose 4,6-dehydratase
MRTALITGITGQDGSFLTEFLLDKGYVIHGIVRKSSSFNTGRISHLFQDIHESSIRLHLHYGDLTDGSRLERLLNTIQPDEVYNLAAQSHVRVSFDEPLYTANVVALGTLRLLEAVRRIGETQPVRYFQASSSEMFGSMGAGVQNEETPFHPQSPYACAKVFSYHLARNYREAYGMHVTNGILFNHESPRRGETFVTRKITRGLARILSGKEKKIYLGNLDAERDWGYAKDYVEGMWLMLQQETPDDYVLATGQTRSVKDFLDKAFSLVGKKWQDFVEIDPRYLRPSEVDKLKGDSAKAKEKLGWEPKTDFDELVRMMLLADLKAEGVDSTRFGL